MTESFEIVYTVSPTKYIISKVYDVDAGEFLIVGEKGYFMWVPAEMCQLKSVWDAEVAARKKEAAEKEKAKAEEKKKNDKQKAADEFSKWYNEFLNDLGKLFEDPGTKK